MSRARTARRGAPDARVRPIDSSARASRAHTEPTQEENMKKSTRTTASVVVALGAGTMLALAPALAASAHVTASASSTSAGPYSGRTFSVPHGCDRSDATSIQLAIPAALLSAPPPVNPNQPI